MENINDRHSIFVQHVNLVPPWEGMETYIADFDAFLMERKKAEIPILVRLNRCEGVGSGQYGERHKVFAVDRVTEEGRDRLLETDSMRFAKKVYPESQAFDQTYCNSCATLARELRPLV